MKLNKIVAGAALAVLSSSAAMAGALTGNVGAVSTYTFRGVDQTNSGAALQGGVDYTVGNGLYAGTWASNIEGGNELDIYGGYTNSLFGITYDVGAIFYAYSEADEFDADGDTDPANEEDPNTAELYAGASFGPVSGKLYFSNDLAGTDEASLYATVAATLAFNDTLSLVPSIGFFSGDGVKAAFGDEYTDYSIALVKSLKKDNLSFSFAVVGTDLDDATTGQGDDPKFVIGAKRTFKM